MKVWVRYTVFGWFDSKQYKDEIEFRKKHLGPDHWSSESTAGERRDITLHMEEDIALLFALRYSNCRIDKSNVLA